jgi:3-deoxy-D-glycero-D-galacto-nononate 9-phosphatase
MLPEIVFTDIDGVWTDGGMYYDQTGNESKRFNTSDSAGVLFLHHLNIPVCFITGENTIIVENRARKLGIDYIFQDVKDKLSVARELTGKLKIDIKKAAFIGDDLNDITLLQVVGISGVPISAPEYVKKHAQIVIPYKGGEGAFRYFVEHILIQNNLLDFCIESFINKKKSP